MNVYCTGHKHSQRVTEAFAAGCNGIIRKSKSARLHPGPSVFYGWLRGNAYLIELAKRSGAPWYYIDNGYLRSGHYDGYYRVTANAYQLSAIRRTDPNRYHALGITIDAWRDGGTFSLICPPNEEVGSYHNIDVHRWVSYAKKIRREAGTDHYVIRPKGSSRPLEHDLEGCHLLITAFSNVAVEAVRRGVAVHCTHPCAATPMSIKPLEQPDRPLSVDRMPWLYSLANNQWTLDEMASGLCWRQLSGDW